MNLLAKLREVDERRGPLGTGPVLGGLGPLSRCDTDLTARRSLYFAHLALLAYGSPPRPPCLSSEVVHTVSDVSGVQSHGGNGQRVPLERVRPRVGRGNVRTERKGNPESWGQHRLRCHFQFFQFCLLQPLGFGSSVLKPDFDLGFRQV